MAKGILTIENEDYKEFARQSLPALKAYMKSLNLNALSSSSIIGIPKFEVGNKVANSRFACDIYTVVDIDHQKGIYHIELNGKNYTYTFAILESMMRLATVSPVQPKYKVGDILVWNDDQHAPKVEYTIINTDKNTRKYELEYIDPTTTNKDTYWYPIDSTDRGKVSLVGSTTSTVKFVPKTVVSTTIPTPTEVPQYKVGDVLGWKNPSDAPSDYVVKKVDEENKVYLLEMNAYNKSHVYSASYDFEYIHSNAVLINSLIKDPIKKVTAYKYRCPKCHQFTVSLMFTHYVCDRCNARFTTDELFPAENRDDRGW